MTSVLSVALICACALVCSGALYDQYPYRGQKPEAYDGGHYKPSVPGKYYPEYRYQDYSGHYKRYRRSVPYYGDGSYPSHYPSYPKGYPSYPKGYPSYPKGYPSYPKYPTY
ncbi:adhesive plaque matrix protein-like [Haliotis rubra]|uniref:adhesive plaque matrix protein-like n=1 Tax=Haliotis rubra TaxID=36100 RepID=UPI001EE609E7|nr:adhesive plaque matrix protein-like [Haliotis rubra]